jgi:CheY-like chemotaxis protein
VSLLNIVTWHINREPEDQFRQIPVIYFTSEEDIALLAAEAGADGHLMKPFDIEALLCVARQYAA